MSNVPARHRRPFRLTSYHYRWAMLTLSSSSLIFMGGYFTALAAR